MNSIIGSQSAEKAPDAKDWAQLQERLNSDKKIKESEKDFKKLEKQIAINKMLNSELAKIIHERIEKIEKRVKKLESKKEEFKRFSESDIEIVTENAGPFKVKGK